METLTKRQANVVVRRLAKRGIQATAEHHSGGSTVTLRIGRKYYYIETVTSAHRWAGYPDLSE